MTKQEREKKIEQVEGFIFMIHMADRWTKQDRENLAELEEELKKLKKEG